MASEPDGLTSEQAMVGILALLAADREDRTASRDRVSSEQARKTELVLADAGLTAAQIGRILGKKPNSVAKTISRARAKGIGSEGSDA